ncbi:hypothetical protein CIB48_g8823 [Xylaria polymorpha]|nr:hypothetical protein CIB48_g8823 [Xylaria polymorpha]
MDRHGRPDEEMFLNKPAEDCDSPTVEPLRIFKPQSPKPQADKMSDRFKYPAPVASKPSFPLPPGASSSAAPLPYPDDDDLRIGQSTQSSRPPYLSDDRKPSTSKIYTSPAGPSGSGRLNDTTPRLDTSPIDKRGPGLAERRGTAPKPLPWDPQPFEPPRRRRWSIRETSGASTEARCRCRCRFDHAFPRLPPETVLSATSRVFGRLDFKLK